MRIGLYIWDDVKNQVNIQKHGIDFRTAIRIFDDENRIELYDVSHSYDEDRFIAIGSADGMITVLYIVFTERNNLIRIISARKANDEERRAYYDSFC